MLSKSLLGTDVKYGSEDKAVRHWGKNDRESERDSEISSKRKIDREKEGLGRGLKSIIPVQGKAETAGLAEPAGKPAWPSG